MGKKKTAKFGARVNEKKRVVIQEHHLDDGHPLAWRFGRPDRGGPFAWQIACNDKYHEVMHKLFEFEDKNWNEITASGSHPIPAGNLCDEARNRLVEIQRDDLDQLLSLRLTGTNRVWCIKTGHILRPLWWDEPPSLSGGEGSGGQAEASAPQCKEVRPPRRRCTRWRAFLVCRLRMVLKRPPKERGSSNAPPLA